MPGLHDWQADAAAGEYCPAAQLVQLVAPVPAAKVPATQFVHVVEPAAAAEVPAAQAGQEVAPVLA